MWYSDSSSSESCRGRRWPAEAVLGSGRRAKLPRFSILWYFVMYPDAKNAMKIDVVGEFVRSREWNLLVKIDGVSEFV
jgi:hypothetical protein